MLNVFEEIHEWDNEITVSTNLENNMIIDKIKNAGNNFKSLLQGKFLKLIESMEYMAMWNMRQLIFFLEDSQTMLITSGKGCPIFVNNYKNMKLYRSILAQAMAWQQIVDPWHLNKCFNWKYHRGCFNYQQPTCCDHNNIIYRDGCGMSEYKWLVGVVSEIRRAQHYHLLIWVGIIWTTNTAEMDQQLHDEDFPWRGGVLWNLDPVLQ